MCWSGEASTVIAATGFATTAYSAYRGDSKALWLPLGYFSLMEALQAYTYTCIDDCGSLNNQIATLLGWIHICFQPFFIQLISLHFIPDDIRAKIRIPAYTLTFAATVVLLLSMYPFEGASICSAGGDIVCGKKLCSITGEWHIAWEIPRRNFGFMVSNLYLAVAFILPLLYGSWKMTLYHALTGPLLSYLSTNSLNEMAAVWCLYSIGLLMIVAKTPLRDKLHVRSWPLFTLIRRFCPLHEK